MNNGIVNKNKCLKIMYILAVNAEKYKHEVGHREDRPRRGGKNNQYNRRGYFSYFNFIHFS